MLCAVFYHKQLISYANLIGPLGTQRVGQMLFEVFSGREEHTEVPGECIIWGLPFNPLPSVTVLVQAYWMFAAALGGVNKLSSPQ